MSDIDLNELPTRGVSVTDYGATGDGVTDDHHAFQSALDSGASPVVIPRGTYKIGGALRIGSNTRVLAHQAAHMFLADGAGTGPDVFLLTNRDHEDGNCNITVSGGRWDGNNPGNPRGPDEPTSYSGVLINFSNVTGLDLNNMTLRDPESYFIRLARHVRRFRIEDIRFEARNLRPNQDGVHLGGYCEDGVICDLEGTGIATPNDDVVALNGDDANDRAQNLGKECGPIRNIRVQNIRASDCHSFVRMLSVWHPVENIEIENVRGGCRNCALNLDAGRYCKVPPFDADDPEYARGAGELRNIEMRDFEIYKSEPGHQKPLIHLETRAYNFNLEGFRRDSTRDASPGASTLRVFNMHPEATVNIRGLSADQASSTLAASELPQPALCRELRPGDHPSLSLSGCVGTDGLCEVPAGGMDAFSM